MFDRRRGGDEEMWSGLRLTLVLDSLWLTQSRPPLPLSETSQLCVSANMQRFDRAPRWPPLLLLSIDCFAGSSISPSEFKKKNQKQNTDWYAPSFLLFGHEFQHILKNSSFFFLSLLVLTSILPILCLITQRIQDYSPGWRFILIRMVSWCFVSVSTEALNGQTKHSSIYIV